MNMKRTFLTAAAIATAVLGIATSPAAQAADVGVSISISQPGVYGRVDIGRFPQPQVILPQPVIIAPPRGVVVRPEPVYLWVPLNHRRNWAEHCREYNACGVPVYFVRHDWYDKHVRRAEVRRDERDERHDDHDRGKGKGRDRD
jgi:hypothetical protein